MKKIIITVISVMVLFAVLVPSPIMAVPVCSQTWYLDANPFGLTTVPGDTDGTIVGIGPSLFYLYSTTPAGSGGVYFPQGPWNVTLDVDAQWSGAPVVHIYYCDSLKNNLISAGETGLTSNYAAPYYTLTIANVGPFTVPSGGYVVLGIQTSSGFGNIICYNHTSLVTAPCSTPGFPVPELGGGALLALGLVGLGGFIVIRGRNRSGSTL